MSREELIAENAVLKEKLKSLSFQINQLQKIVFGEKRERFVPETADNQLNLFSEPESKDPEEEPTEDVAYTKLSGCWRIAVLKWTII